MDVFVLSYMYPLPDGTWPGTFIGVYSSRAQAERAIERLRPRPGFRDFPTGFRIEPIRLDEDRVQEGFFPSG